jgi:hypothetical protein
VIVSPPNALKSCFPSIKAEAQNVPTGTLIVVELSKEAEIMPHCPKGVGENPNAMMTCPFGFVLFTILTLALSPSQVVNGWLQGSLPPTDAAFVLVGRILMG